MLWLVLGQSAQSTATPATQTASAPAEPPTISDNSFLVEEAYNQEKGVVQHINMFTKDWTTHEWVFGFTQEWPVNPAPRHQLSYSIGALSGSPGQGDGVGDIWFNYRYQVTQTDRVAIAPRASAIVPTGNAEKGRGAGGFGVDVSLPVSITPAKAWALHTNVGTTFIDDSEDEDGNRATTAGWRVAQSVIWLPRARVNFLIETVAARQQSVTGPNQTIWESSFTLSPGIRWAYNFANGLQIVPGIAVPIGFHKDASNEWTVLGYLSFEHPFGKRK